jgi:phage terminase small subunit
MTAQASRDPVPAKAKRHRRPKYSAVPTIVVPPEEDLGPCMLACTPKQRRFVLELRNGPAGYGSEIKAARAAGYGSPTSSDTSVRVMAHQVLHNPKVQDALREVGHRIIRAASFQSLKNTVEIANDLKHRDCLRANLALMDRGFPIETTHTVKVERTPDVTVIVTEAVLERIRKLALAAGLDPIKQIEAVAAPADANPVESGP